LHIFNFLTQQVAGFIACRFFLGQNYLYHICRPVLTFPLGLMEGGLLPGLILYMSSFYRRHQLQTRVAFLFSATSLAGAFSVRTAHFQPWTFKVLILRQGLLAAAIVNMNHVGGKPGWSWIVGRSLNVSARAEFHPRI
jgi:MFS family permease